MLAARHAALGDETVVAGVVEHPLVDDGRGDAAQAARAGERAALHGVGPGVVAVQEQGISADDVEVEQGHRDGGDGDVDDRLDDGALGHEVVVSAAMHREPQLFDGVDGTGEAAAVDGDAALGPTGSGGVADRPGGGYAQHGLLLNRLAVLVLLDDVEHALLVEAHEDEGAEQAEDHGDKRGETVAEAADAHGGERGEQDHGERLAERHGEGAGSEVHALAALAVLEGIALGDVGENRLGKDAEDGHGDGGEHGDDAAPDERGDAEHAADGGDAEGEAEEEESEGHDLLLADLLGEDVHGGVEEQADARHAGEQHEVPGLVEPHEGGHVEGHAGLEHGDGDPVEDVGDLEDLERLVLEGLLDGLDHVHGGGLGLGVDVLVDREGGDEHEHDGDGGEDGDRHAVGVRDAQRRLEEARDGGHEIGERGAEEEGDGDVGREVDADLLRAAELGDERVEGRAVERERHVEENEADEQGDVVELLGAEARDREDHDGHDAERDGGVAHERDAAAQRVVELIGLAGDEGIDEAVDEAAQRRDEADDRHAREDDALRDEQRHALGDDLLARRVEVQQPVAHDAREHRPAQLADREVAQDAAIGKFLLHLIFSPYSFPTVSSAMPSV